LEIVYMAECQHLKLLQDTHDIMQAYFRTLMTILGVSSVKKIVVTGMQEEDFWAAMRIHGYVCSKAPSEMETEDFMSGTTTLSSVVDNCFEQVMFVKERVYLEFVMAILQDDWKFSRTTNQADYQLKNAPRIVNELARTM